MEAELKLLFVAIGRCSERLIFAETGQTVQNQVSKAADDMIRWFKVEVCTSSADPGVLMMSFGRALQSCMTNHSMLSRAM